MERAGRIVARWMPNRQEDFAGRAARLELQFPGSSKPSCREDMVCAKPLGEVWKAVSWQWLSPVLSPDFATLALQLKSTGGPQGKGTLPTTDALPNPDNPYAASVEQLKAIFEDLPLPVLFNLVASPRTP